MTFESTTTFESKEGAASRVAIEYAVGIVSSAVAGTGRDADAISDMIRKVHATITGLSSPVVPAVQQAPAVPVGKSVTYDYIISLETGQKFKMLKSHLTGLGMTPEQYRAKWGLMDDYPMVAPGYSARRSQWAKDSGLGRKK